QFWVPFWRVLNDVSVKTSLVPPSIRRAAKVIDNVMAATGNFSSFHREVNFTGAGIPQHKLELGAYRILQELRESITRAVCSGRPAFGRYFRINNVGDRFVGRIRAHVNHSVIALRISDPYELSHIEFHLRTPDKLINIEPVGRHDRGQS